MNGQWALLSCLLITGPGVDHDALIQPVTNAYEGAEFDVASKRCEDLGGGLISIYSYEITMAIAQAVTMHSYPLWIGLSANETMPDPVWSDGSTLDFQLWSPDDGVIRRKPYCVEMDVTKYSGTWRKNTGCIGSLGRQHGYVCAVPKASAPLPPFECPQNYDLYDGSCYRYFSDSKPYSSAQQVCHADDVYSFLASVHSDAENSAVLRLSGGTGHVMLGFRRAETEEAQFAWEDGTYVQTKRWAAKEPAAGKYCTWAHPNDTRWYAADCEQPQSFVCKIYKDEALLPVPDKPGECPDKEHRLWKSHGDYCYYFSEQRKTWWSARDHCLSLGAILTPIHHPDTNDFLRRSVSYSINHWIGYFRNKNGTWEWDVPDVRAYSNWKFGEPKEDDNYNVAALEINSKESPEWVSERDDSLYYFICRGALGDVSTEPPLAEGSCPDESWVQRYGDICYLFQPDMPVTWSEGRRQCQVRGGMRAHLVVIPDLDVNRYIQGMMTEVSVLPMDRGHWIGLSNQTLESGKPVWKWENGDVIGPADWNNWVPAEQQRRNNCVIIRTTNGDWLQQECQGFRGFACQVQLGTGYFEEVKPGKELGHQEYTAIAITVTIICLVFLAFFALYLYQRSQRVRQLPDNEASVAYTRHQADEGGVQLPGDTQ